MTPRAPYSKRELHDAAAALDAEDPRRHKNVIGLLEDIAAGQWTLVPEDSPVRPVWPRDLMLTSDVRRLAGDVARSTLLYWRRHKGFPEPIRAIRVGSKHRSQTVDIYDRRDVRAWLKAHPASGEVKPNRR